MKNLEIRFARDNDCAGLEKLDKKAHKEIKWWEHQNRREFEKIIRSNNFLTLVAEDNGLIVGYLQATLKFDDSALWIEDIYVDKKYRRKGVASRLLDKFTDHWKGKKKSIVLITSDKNVKIFDKIGFTKRANYMVYKP